MSRLLEGVRVLEFAVLFNGDHVGTLLGDHGADVIKVEDPQRGDYLRDFLGQITPHHSPAHIQVNKNKRSVTLDLRHETGKELFWKLLATADVFVDGMIPGAMDRLGIGYEEQRQRKPDIIYCECTGYGARGPYAPIPTHGQMMNALAGAVPLKIENGQVQQTSPKPGWGIHMGGEGTACAGIYGAYHVAAALVHRARTGKGCFIDISAADAVIASAWNGAIYQLNWHRITEFKGMPSTDRGRGQARYTFYETQDQKFILFCGIEHVFFERFCRAVGRPELLVEQRKDDAPVDFAVADERLRRELQTVFHSKPLAEWTKVAIEHRIPIGPAYQEVQDVFNDPHFKQRQIFCDAVHPHAGPFTYVGQPGIVEGQPFEVRYPAPLLGEHTDQVLREIGCTDAELDRWRQLGII